MSTCKHANAIIDGKTEDELRLHYAHPREFPMRLKLARWIGRQRWFPRGQNRLMRLLVPPGDCPHYAFEVDFFGQRYQGDLASYIDWMVCCYGAYAMPELTLLRECIRWLRKTQHNRVIALDVGANVGHHTLFMAPLVDEVFSFEPYPPLQDAIRNRISLNRLTNVTLVPVGLGEADSVLDFYPGTGRNLGVGSFLPEMEKQHGEPTKLRIRCGDQFLDESAVGPISILKIDVQGFEPLVLRGLQKRIHKDRPIILTELTEESRRGFGSQRAFFASLYPGARIAEVSGRNGRRFRLTPFVYERAAEVLVFPPEMEEWVS